MRRLMRTHVEAANDAVKIGTYNKGNVETAANVAIRSSAPDTQSPKSAKGNDHERTTAL